MKNKEIERFINSEKLRVNFSSLEKITDKWGFFRQIYMENICGMLKASEKEIKKWHQVYSVDWVSFFSPIETDTWNSIRCQDSIVLYPQFPLFNYFIDFANPYLKIGLELDGKNYHDPIKDKKRDELLYEYGWKIYRIKGSETYTKFNDIFDVQENEIVGDERKKELKNWILNTSDGVVFALKVLYFISENEKEDYRKIELFDYEPDETIDIVEYCELSLKKHCLVEFDK